MTLDSLVIEIVELSLTLIKVVKVCTLQCNLSMGFIDLGTTVKANKRICFFILYNLIYTAIYKLQHIN